MPTSRRNGLPVGRVVTIAGCLRDDNVMSMPATFRQRGNARHKDREQASLGCSICSSGVQRCALVCGCGQLGSNPTRQPPC
jgi:hypothetical protein